MGNLFTQASAYLREHKEYHRWVALFLCLALVISTATTALLTRPGVAMTHTERVLSCPFEGEAAHTHTEDCYQDGVLVCTLPERELHTHTEDCYTTEKTLTCEEEESDGHVHTEDCYSLVQGELTCTDESEEHEHTADCYAWESVLSCGLEEGEGAHRHTDDCYTETKILTCGQEELLTEHVHGPGCFTEIVVEDEEPEATEPPAPAETPAPTETPAETETPAVEEIESDPEADLEYYWMWTEFFSHVTLTGDWNEDLVTVARTQLGYTESARNFTVDEDGRHGYTRYGEWYGLPHGDWCAMFVSFCLNFSDIPREAMPWESVTTRWVKNLTERGMFAMADSDYVPKAGDLVFFTDPEYRERVASHVGIVAEVTDEYIISIEGNNGPAVAEFKYELDDEHIYGYGILPEEPEPEESPAESGLALITAADGTALPEDAQPHAYTLSGPEAEAAQSAVEAWLTSPEGPQMLQTRRASARMAVAERNAAEDEVLSETKYQVFEIGLDNVEASEYEDGFLVRVTLPEALTGRDFTLFHLGDDGVEELAAEYNGIYHDNGTETVTGFSFVTDSFSPFVLRYTVDFHYTAEDGKTYDFSMPGGGFLTLPELVQALHLAQEGEEQAFASAVESITFSDPSLLWVGRADENTTVGALKASLNLNSAYSADLTASDIAALNETAVSAGEWLLISLHPFDSLETLTITMRDGREISVDVTDARIVAYYLNDRGELYEVGVTYGEDALIPDGATLKITEYAQDSAEYLKARGEVLADLEKNEVSVDPDSFGLAALDISILDAEGNEIEPAAPVQVDMSIKALPGVENLQAIAETLVVNHHVETETGVELQTVFAGSTEGVFQFNMPVDADQPVEVNALPGDQAVTMSFETPSFSTFSVGWGNTSGGNVGTYANRRANDLVNDQQYILYAYDAATEKYYALVPGTELNTVEIALDGNNVVQYAGDKENLYWNVTRTGDSFIFSFTENDTTYYLAEGTAGDHVVASTSRQDYDSSNTTDWQQYNNYIHSAQHTFLRCEDGVFKTVYKNNFNEWSQSLIYFERKGVRAPTYANNTTIHYGYMDGTRFVEFTDQPYPTAVTTSHHAYLIYDFDGYQYEGHTYYRTAEAPNGANMTSGATSIQPRLQYYNNSRWIYYSDAWRYVEDGSHIYVVYEKQPDDTVGGTPKIKQSAQVTPPNPPTITKESTPNGDGTNTLTLSVSGHTTQLEVEKLADVIVVFDISGSMSTTDMSRKSRLEAGRDAINALAHTLLNKTNSYGDKLIRMGLITFSTDAQVVQGLTDDETVFTTAVNNQKNAEGGTNWEKALMLANQMAVDPERATFVIFVTDGDPTFRVSRTNVTDAQLSGDLYNYGGNDNYYVSNYVFGAGDDDDYSRNYNAAADVARRITNPAAKKTLYTIGISSDVTKLNNFADEVGAKDKFTATSTAALSKAFDDIAASIIALMGHSSVQINDGITSMTQTVEKTGLTTLPSEDDFVYTKERLATAAEIANPSTIPTGAVLEDREGTKYVVWYNWDPTTERANKASFVKAADYDTSKKGAVVWNMGDNFMLEDGVTYKVSFKVWPSQKAYDLLARLNNGTIGWDDLTEDQQAQIYEDAEGKYHLRTNEPNAGYSYKEATKSGDTVTPKSEEPITGTFDPVIPLNLVSIPLEVRKDWRTSLVSANPKPSQIEMDLLSMDYGTATSTYKTVTLSEANNWYSNGNHVSYGLVKRDSSSLVVYEQGHDFTLEEKYNQNSQSDLLASHYWSFDPGIYRPMVVGEGATTRQTVLERITNDSGIPAAFTGSTSPKFWHDTGAADSSNPLYAANMRPTYNGYTGHYYWLPDANGDYHAYIDTGSNVILLAINKQRSFVDLIKKVDDDQTCDKYFTFTGIIHVNTEGMTQAEIDINQENFVWASVYGTSGRISPAEYEEISGTGFIKPSQAIAGYTDSYDGRFRVVQSDVPFSLKIKADWSVRFLNLPTGSTVEFTEIDIPGGYEFNSADFTVKRVDELTGHVVTETLMNAGSDKKVQTTIAEADAGYTATFHNGPQVEKTKIKVEKQWSDGEHNGDPITYTVYQKAVTASNEVVREIEYRTGTITGTGSVIVDNLPLTGWVDGQDVTFEYYVVETRGKDGYTPVIIRTQADPADPKSTETLTIRNVPKDKDIDKDTPVSFTKEWKGPGGTAPTLNHDGDQIQVKLIQKAVDSGYVPVTVKLINGNGGTYDNKTYFVPKESTVTLTATRPGDDNHTLTVTLNGTTVAGIQSGREFSYSVSSISSALTIEARLNYQNQYNNSRYDKWGVNTATDGPYGMSGYYVYTWSSSLNASGTLQTSIPAIVAAAASNPVVQTQEYIYTLGKNTLTGAPYTGTATDWVGTLPNLPLFRKIDNSTFYAYYYSVEELSVNGEAIRPTKPTGAGSEVIGQTDGYIVSQNGMTITNTEKEKVSVSVTKVWKKADGSVMANPPAGAEIIFDLYRDNEGTGLLITLNGLKDVKSSPGDGEEAKPFLIEANTYESASWVATWENLPKYHDDGTTEYVYTVKEASGWDGYDTVYDPVAATAAQPGGTITNQQQLKSFSFSKAWIPLNSTINSVALDALEDWGADRTISVALHRVDPDTSADEVICSYVLGGTGTFLPTDAGLSPEQKEAYKLTASSTGKLVTFTMGRGLLPENASGHPYTYYVVETNATGGIYNTYYGERNSDAVTWTQGLQKAYDGQVILNHHISTYVLPSTGGIGTLGYQLGGLALIGAALAGLLLRKARRRAKGGDLTA